MEERAVAKGGNRMNNFEIDVTYRFAAFCKSVLRHSAYQWFEKRRKQEEKEVFISFICENSVWEKEDPRDYTEMEYYFKVHGMDVYVRDERLGFAISHLDEVDQDIILLFFFLDFKHREIADLCGYTVRTVCRRQRKALNMMRRELEENYV